MAASDRRFPPSTDEEGPSDARAASDRERMRWAVALHDQTLQGLAAVRVTLASARRRGSGQAMERASEQAEDQLAAEIERLRGLIRELRPEDPDRAAPGEPSDQTSIRPRSRA